MTGFSSAARYTALYAIALALALALAGCLGSGSGGGSGNNLEAPGDALEDDITQPDPQVLEVQVTASSTTVTQGRTVELTAVALYEDESEENVTGKVDEWRVDSDADGDVLSIEVDEQANRAFATGQQAGQAGTVSAEFRGRSGGTSISVVNPALQTLRISPEQPSALPVGTSLQFTAEGEFEGGFTADVSDEVTWSVDDETFATITTDGGLLNAATEGSTQVVATFDAQPEGTAPVTHSVPVTVTTATIDALAIHSGHCDGDSPLAALDIDHSALEDVSACATYTDDSSEDVTNSASWSVEQEDVVRLERVGGTPAVATLSGRSPGNTRLTAAFAGDEASIDIQVLDAPAAPAALRLRAQPNVILAGADDETRVTATVTPNDPDNEVIAEQLDISLAASPSGLLDNVPAELQTGEDGNNAQAGFTTSGTTSEPTVVTLEGQVPRTLALGQTQIRVVDDFARIFARVGLVNQEEDLLVLVVRNTSNRMFEVEGFDVYKGEKLSGSFEPDQLFQQEIEPGGPGIQAVNFSRGLDLDDEIRLQFRLRDPATGTSFTVALEFF